MNYNVGIITISNKLVQEGGENIQERKVSEFLESSCWTVKYTNTITGDNDIVTNELIKCADELELALVVTIGGSGYSPESFVPEITQGLINREVRGIHEKMRSVTSKTNPNGWLTRGIAGLRNKTLIVNLPGSAKAAVENLSVAEDVIKHVIDMVWPNDEPFIC